LVKFTPVVNFINILRANFSYESIFYSFFYLYVTREKLPKRHSYKKFAHKMLMKLTPKGAISPTSLCAAFAQANPKITKRQSIHSVFLHFWDLFEQMLLFKCS
jgi:hypothetical protein